MNEIKNNFETILKTWDDKEMGILKIKNRILKKFE